MVNNTPVYEFLGYRMLKANYNRQNNNPLEHFTIKSVKSIFNEETSVYALLLEVTIKFENDDHSVFIFDSAFKINDLSWKQQIPEEQLQSLFVSVMFPFVRGKIYSITEDLRIGIILPIIDLRQIDLSKGAKFSPKNNEINE